MSAGGLENFDPNAAAVNLAAVGQPALPPPVAPVDPLQGPPTPVGLAGTPALPPPVVAPPDLAAPASPIVVPTGTTKGIADSSVAEQKAAQDTAAAVKKAAEESAKAQDDAAKAHEAEAEQLRVQAEQHARANDEATVQVEKAANAARDYHIPNFWEGKDGKRAESAIWVGLGAFGAGLLGSNTNQAADIIDKAVDSYYRREKDKVDNLYKFANMKSGDRDALRARQAQEHVDLMAQHGATNLAIAAKIQKTAELSKGRVDEAKANALSAEYAAKGQKAILDAKNIQSEINLRNAEAARQRAEKNANNPAANAAEAQVMALVEKNAPPSEVRALAAKLGVKPTRVDALENQGRADAKLAAAGGGSKVPGVLTDTLTGKDLPVDPKRTDARKHNAAVAGLPMVNGAIQILDEVLKNSKTQHAPEFLARVGFDTTAQADLTGKMTRFRSAYAASKKESVGEANAKELAEAIPDPPSAFSSSSSFANWRRKIESTANELHDTRNALLANAGVPHEALDRREGTPETKNVNGVTYYKVPGGWSDTPGK